ncbi:uncharacterized protein [Taeniopygia guttata]|uniref:uncharacterized protein n=1 Tax=Taeniopygia guttata TaxID=59729 RepID=UPI003BB99681
MDGDLQASVRLLFHILSKRAEKVKEADLEQLVLWARSKGKLQKPSLLFSETEWQELGQLLWDAVIEGKKDKKTLLELGGVWKKVSHTLQSMAAEKEAAEAAIRAFEQSTAEQIETRKPSRVEKFFNVCNMRPVRGQKAPVSPSVRDVVARLEGGTEPGSVGLAGARRSGDAAAPGAEVCSRAADVNSSAVSRNAADQEVALPGPLGGGETPEEAGGVGDETGLSQEEELRGGDQGRDQGGDGSEAAPAPRPPAAAAAAAATGACKRRGAARRYPPAATATASSLARFGGAGHPNASGVAEVATQTTPEQSPENASSHPTTVARHCPLPPSSDSDDSEPDFPVVNCSRDTRSQNKIQRPNTLQKKIARLATLSNRQVQAVEPSTGQQLASPAVLKNPLQSRWASVVKDALLDGDWKAASSLACPVIVSNGNAIWEPHDWKILQSAKQTVTTYGIRSEAARNIIQYIFTADVLCPSDSSNIASLLLTPSQFLMFEREWKRLAVEEANKHTDAGDPFFGVQPDMLTGQGPYATNQVQLTFPIEIHQLSQQLAHQALLLVPDKKKSASYATIKQGATEPFGQFIDRLSAALKDAPDVPPDVQEHLFRSLAFENANPPTRTILATLPQGCPVDEMLVRATRAEQSNQAAAFAATIQDAIEQQGHIIAAALSSNNTRKQKT